MTHTTEMARLTADEQEAIENAWIIAPKDGPSGDNDPMYLAVERIVGERIATMRTETERMSAILGALGFCPVDGEALPCLTCGRGL